MAVISRPRSPSPGKLLTMTVIVLGLVFGLYRLVLHQVAARYLQNLSLSIPGCTGIRYSRLSMPYFALQIHIQNITFDFGDGIAPITADAVHIRRFRTGDQFPRVLDLALDGVVLRTDHPLLPFGSTLQDLGYPMLRGDLRIQWDRRGETQDAWDLNLMIKMAEAGETALAFQVAKVNAKGVVLALAQPYNWLLVLPAVELTAFRGTYRDGGLFGRTVGALARARGQSPEVFREAMQRWLQMQQQRETNPDIQPVWRSLAAFCRHPVFIRLRTDLARPIPLGQLVWLHQPRDLIQRLALKCYLE